jgi:large subunit ribosomal protein L31e
MIHKKKSDPSDSTHSMDEHTHTWYILFSPLSLHSALRKRSPHAVKAVKQFAQKAMGTSDVRIDPSLNKALWARGVKHTDHRIRVRIARKRNDDEDAKEKLYSYVTYVPVASFKGKSAKQRGRVQSEKEHVVYLR